MQMSTLDSIVNRNADDDFMEELFGPGGADSPFKRTLHRYMNSSYMEAQIHGQVRKEDIAEMHVGTRQWDDLDDYVRDEIKRLGIRVVINGKGDLEDDGW